MKKWVVLICIFLLGLGFIIVTSINENHSMSEAIVDKYVYKSNGSEIKEIYITILPYKGDYSEYANNFTDLNERYYSDLKVKIIFQEGENGSINPNNYGYTLTDSNGTMELRGQSSRNDYVKSYKIKLNDDYDMWDGHKVINLNKHCSDDLCIRNKLSLDYISTVSNLSSMKTQFIHLYIKDFSKGDYSQGYEDYGLYTQVENIDDDFLINHGLDTEGTIYKAEFFEFFRYPNNLRLKGSNDYSKEAFEEILEIKTNDNPEKIIEMLDDLNNELIHINDVIDKHFNRENYITWLATNILIGNIDTGSKNFLLYSPSNVKTWYFLPWDCDGTWGFVNKMGEVSDIVVSCHEGVANYWGVVLHRRFLENEQNVQELSEKIEELSSRTFTEETTKMFLTQYWTVVSDFYDEEPYILYNTWTEDELKNEWNRILQIIEENKDKYYLSLEKPMPVFMGEPINEGGYYIFTWNKSYDLQGDSIKYSIEISDSHLFETLIYQAEEIKDTQHVVNNLSPGTYYWRINIIDSDGNTQISFNQYALGYHIYYGIQEFIVN